MRYTMIRTEHLTKQFANRTAVNGLSFEVEPGEIFGFLGMNGAGKTTTIRMLLDYVRPTEGRAYVLNLDTRRQSVSIRRQVGYMPQSLPMTPGVTGGQFLRYLARMRHTSDCWKRALDLAGQFQLDLNRPVAALSRSAQRALALIQALMHDPELLILDEPTAGMDAETQSKVYPLLSAIRADGRSVFMASSSLTEMERICDRVGLIHRGELLSVERGVQLRSRALRRVEMRFAGPVNREAFTGIPNIQEISLQDNLLRCTVKGDPDALIKTASQFRVTDMISQTPSLEEVFANYYGVGPYAA